MGIGLKIKVGTCAIQQVHLDPCMTKTNVDGFHPVGRFFMIICPVEIERGEKKGMKWFMGVAVL